MHDIDATRPDHQCLFQVASEHSGYFTTAQADACGYSSNLRSYHVKHGRWVRVRRGNYRLSENSSSDREEVIAAWLWVGKDIAVVSHHRGFDLLDLSDLIPDTIHIVIPRSRRYRPASAGITLRTTTREFKAGGVTSVAVFRSPARCERSSTARKTGAAPEEIVVAVGRWLVGALPRSVNSRLAPPPPEGAGGTPHPEAFDEAAQRNAFRGEAWFPDNCRYRSVTSNKGRQEKIET